MPDNKFATLRETNDPASRIRGFQFEGIPVGEIEVLDMTPGIHVEGPRDKRPPGSAEVARNGRSRHDWVGRRPGTVEIIDNPDGDVVLRVYTVHLDQDRRWLVRVTKNAIYATQDAGGWGPPITGPALGFDRRVDATQHQGRLYLTHPAKKLIEIDFQSRTYKEVEGAPRSRYTTSFADRVIVANVADKVGGWRGTKLQWSANGDSREWDSLEDESAGEVFLDSAPSDYGDEITGIFPIGQLLVVLRERSVWVAERQPFAADPFRFTPVSVGVGCDLPFTGQIVPGGLVWADRRTRSVYFWSPGRQPQAISSQIMRELYADIDVSEWVEGAYDPFEMEYHLGLNVPGVIIDNRGECVETKFMTKFWVHNFAKQSWCYDIGPVASTMGNIVGVADQVFINELTGTINEQVPDSGDALKPNPDGWINDWGHDPEDIFQPALFKGTPTGEVIYFSWLTDIDFDCSRFDFVWQSQNLGHPSKARTLRELLFLSRAMFKGRVVVEMSKNNHIWREMKSLRPEALPYRQRLAMKKQFSGDDMWFRITSSAGGFRMYEFWARVLERARHGSGG